MAIIDKGLLPWNIEGDLRREGKGCLALLEGIVHGLPFVPEEEPDIIFDDKVERVHYRGRTRRLSEEWLQQLVTRLLKEGKCVLAYSIALLYDLDRYEEIAAKARELAGQGDEIAIAAHRAISWAMEILMSGGTPDAAYHRAIRKSVAPERRSIKNPELRRDCDEAIESYENRSMEALKLGEYREIGGKKEIVLYLNAIFRANALNHAPWTQRIDTPQGLEEVLSVYAHEYFHFLHHYYSESNGAGGRIVRESLATYFQCLRDKEAGRRDMDLIDYCGVHNPYVYPYSGALCLEEDPAAGRSRLKSPTVVRGIGMLGADTLTSAQSLYLYGGSQTELSGLTVMSVDEEKKLLTVSLGEGTFTAHFVGELPAGAAAGSVLGLHGAFFVALSGGSPVLYLRESSSYTLTPQGA